MPPGADEPTLNPALPIIFHNIPYANLGCGAESEPFGYPLAAVKEIAPAPGGHAGAPSAQFHG
jgi:hypothetical protein